MHIPYFDASINTVSRSGFSVIALKSSSIMCAWPDESSAMISPPWERRQFLEIKGERLGHRRLKGRRRGLPNRVAHFRSMSFIMSSVMGMTSKSLKNISQLVPPCICRPSFPVFSHASSTISDVQNPLSVWTRRSP